MPDPPRPYAVRSPLPEDAPGLGHAHWLTWQEAYRGVMPDDYLERQTEDRMTAKWQVRLEMDEPDGIVAVGVSPDGEVLGFASGGPTRDDDAPVAWELYAVNIVGTAYGVGLGHDLVAAVTGDRPNHLWVIVDNPRARAFYAKEGYVPDGVEKIHEASGCLEMRMVRR
jgi:hypothetical protein